MSEHPTAPALSDGEELLVSAYRSLAEALSSHRGQLAPFEERNALKALAALWQVMNGLDLDPGQLYDLGA
jgi:hypothetical protein